MNRPSAAGAAPRIPNYLAIGAALLTVLVWASAFPLIHIALAGLDPLPLAASRFWLAGIIASAWLLAARPTPPSPRDAATFLVCGLVGIALYNAFLNTGQRTVSPGAASFLINTGPIITTLLAAVFLKQRFALAAWIGSAVAFGGVAIIATGQPGGLQLGAGASLILLAALCQASYFVIQWSLVPRYGALACTAYTIIAGALLLTPWLPAAIGSLAIAGASSQTAHALLALVLLPSILGYAAWTFALGTLGAPRAANFLYLVPPVATGISYALTGDAPSSSTILGGLLAIGGVAIVNLGSKIASTPSSTKSLTKRALVRASGTWGGYQASRSLPTARRGNPQRSAEAGQKATPLNCREELARL